MSKICVIGGSRYFGRSLVVDLRDAGHEVTVVNRGSVPAPPGVRHLVTDRADLAANLGDARFDVVVDQVCYTPVQAMAAVAAFRARTERYVLTSTIEVYDELDADAPLPESAVEPREWQAEPWAVPGCLDDHYGEGKRQAEAVFATAPFAVVRPGHVLGGADFTGRLTHYVERVRAQRPGTASGAGGAAPPAVVVHSPHGDRAFPALGRGSVVHRPGQRVLARRLRRLRAVHADRRAGRGGTGLRGRCVAVRFRPVLRHGQRPCREAWFCLFPHRKLAAGRHRRSTGGRVITRTLGPFEVGVVGLGAMPLSIENRPDRDRALATLRAAVDAGITLIDTADSYHWHAGETGHNEELVAAAVRGRDVVIATKGGRGRPGDGSWTVDASPEHLKRACEGSLRRLGVDAIDLYQLHKPDPRVPWADSVGALAELLEAGKIRAAGMSNVDSEQIVEAHEVLGERLAAVQNRYSPAVRDAEPELRLCASLGIAFLPWSPLGGLARSSLDGPSAAPPDPAFAAFHDIARERGATPQQVGLAWLIGSSPAAIPIPGASRPETARASAAAAELSLSAAELARLG